MKSPSNIAIDVLNWSGRVVMLEAESGKARREYIAQWLHQAEAAGAVVWLLNCDRDQGGPWAGLRDLLDGLVPELQAATPHLLVKHDYELALILPRLRRTLPVRNPTLTDTSPAEERVRNYPADRAFRIIHGAIDLLSEWHHRTPNTHWVIACDNYSQAGPLIHHFFANLVRRRGQDLKLTLILAVDPQTSDTLAAQFNPQLVSDIIQLDLPAETDVPFSVEEMRTLADRLEQQIGDDPYELDQALPLLIDYLRHADQPERLLRYQLHALSLYATQGLYEDAIVYGEAARELSAQHWPENTKRRCGIQFKLHNCYIGLRQVEPALKALEDIMVLTDEPEYLARCYYMQAMLYARYLPNRDFAKAEASLDQGLVEMAKTSLPDSTKLFYQVFNRNGLALIRHFQNRPAEAIDLCESGHVELNARLGPDEHKLHRSVLLYNIAQVHGSVRSYEAAIPYFTGAMQMDPNYSEYYNERGNMYLKLGRLDEAERDYLQAIELSPPYAEVWINLGQCYRLMGRVQDALVAYGHALDLDPQQALPFVGRAEMFEELGQLDLALADYTAALTLKSNQPLVLSNRAIVHYQLGDVSRALEDLNEAIILAPQLPDLYQNRAVALTELGRLEEAAHDLRTYLQLSPDAEDRAEVEGKLAALRVEASVG